MKYLRRFNESNSLVVSQCDKSEDSWNFISKFINVIPLEDYLNNINLYQVCALDGDKLVGLRIFRMKDGKIHLNYSAVDPDYRNKGLNQKMFEKILEIAKKQGVSLITSNVRQSNSKSIKSLLKSGFSINDKVEMFYPDGEKKIPLYYKI